MEAGEEDFTSRTIWLSSTSWDLMTFFFAWLRGTATYGESVELHLVDRRTANCKSMCSYNSYHISRFNSQLSDFFFVCGVRESIGKESEIGNIYQ